MNSGKPHRPAGADGNLSQAAVHRRRCRDYLSAAVALNDRLERPAPHVGEEIVHSLRKRRGLSESLGPRFESERAHYSADILRRSEPFAWKAKPEKMGVSDSNYSEMAFAKIARVRYQQSKTWVTLGSASELPRKLRSDLSKTF